MRYAYVTDYSSGYFLQCTINNNDGTFSSCNNIAPSGNEVSAYYQFAFASAGGNLSVHIPGYITTNEVGCYTMNPTTGGVTGVCPSYSDNVIFNQINGVEVSPVE